MLNERLKQIIESRMRAKTDIAEPEKARVKVYDTIKDALKKTGFGQPFSTKGSKRLYVTTKKKWGKDKAQTVGDKVAKGFTPGSAKPGASWKDVKGYAKRTASKHAGKKGSEFK